MSAGRNQTTQLRVENLELRQMMTGNMVVGNVAAFVDHGRLYVEGGNANEVVTITQTGAGRYAVIGGVNAQATTVNGYHGVALSGVTNDIVIDMGGGNDEVFVRGTDNNHRMAVQGSLFINGGSGSDYIDVENVNTAQDIVLSGSSGSDGITARNDWALHDLYLDLGSTMDQPSDMNSALIENDYAGSNGYLGRIQAQAGGGEDSIAIYSSTADYLYAALGNGENLLDIADTTVKHNEWLYGGSSGQSTLNWYNNYGVQPSTLVGFQQITSVRPTG